MSFRSKVSKKFPHDVHRTGSAVLLHARAAASDVLAILTKLNFFQKLLQPYFYILQVPGKLIRAKLARAFDYWLKIPADKLVVVSEIVQMLHNASLL